MRAIIDWIGLFVLAYVSDTLPFLSGRSLSIQLLYLLATAIYNVTLHPLSKFVGPKIWAASPLPYCRAQLSGNIHHVLLDLHSRYGDVVRIAPNQLSYVSDVVWKDVWAYRQGHGEFMKSQLSVAPTVNGVLGILGAPREAHSRYRRLLSHAFSSNGLREQEPKVEKYVDLFVQRLKEYSPEGPQDILAWLNWATFDLIGDLAFGEPFNCLEDARLHPWIEAIYGNLKVSVLTSHVAFYGFSWILPWLVPKRLFELRLINYQYVSDKIERRVKLGQERGDFLDKIIGQTSDKKGMTVEELKSNASNLTLAGSETTATLLSGTIYLLLTHPQVLSKLQHEIFNSFQSEKEISVSGLHELKYLQMVLLEAMRFYPPVPSQAIRTVPAGGDTVAGQSLPAGTLIHFSQYAAYHLASNFANPDSFTPERWENEGDVPEEFVNDKRAVMEPFSVGTRNCIGKNLAWAELRLFLVKILWNFEMELARDTTEQGDWLASQKVYILWEKSPLWVTLSPQTRSADCAARP